MGNLSITASGMVTSVGFNAPASLAALRAGISGVKEGLLWDGESGQYLNACRAALPQWHEGRGKIIDLVSPAILECMKHASGIHPNQIPLLIGVPNSNRPFRPDELDDTLLYDIEKKLNVTHNRQSRVIPKGRVSTFYAIQGAKALIENGAPCCIVAGADSFLQQKVVVNYIEKERLMNENNSNGFIPGEAGCSVLVVPEERAPRKNLLIKGIGFGSEKGTIESNTPLSGEGLTAAYQGALNDASSTYFDVDYRITDLNGEHYKYLEAHIAEGRLVRKYDEDGNNRDKFRDIWHPIEYIGEVGAAIGPCLLGWALHAGYYNYAPGSTALIHVSNDDNLRSAIIAEYKE